MRKPFFITVLICLGISAQAQMIIVPREKLDAVNNVRLSEKSESFRFEATTIAAEPMNEDDGIQTYAYPFENVGSDTLKIGRLVTTCSCVSASCANMMLASGEKSEITVRYNPKGHPGRFERKVFVYVEGEDSPAAVLKLAVNVERGTDVSAHFPVSMGNIRLRRNEVHFVKGTRATERCVFINVGEKPLKLQCESAMMPGCLEFRTQPETVEPGMEGLILISYDPAKGGERPRLPVMMKGLGVPPTQSSITVYIK